MGLTRAEQETIIRWDAEEPTAYIYSADPKTWRKMVRLGIAIHKETTMAGKPSGRFYCVPLARLRWRIVPEGARPSHRGNPDGLRKAQEARRLKVETENLGPGVAGQGGDSAPAPQMAETP